MYDKFFQRFVTLRKNNPQHKDGLSSQSVTEEIIRQSKTKRIKVLLVDDHRIMRACLRRMLDKHDDIEVSGEAADGKEALELAQKIRPGIILMDINMPVMDGIEATRIITQKLSQVRVIGISLNNQEMIIEEMKNAGASAYIKKSEVSELLVETLRSEASVRLSD